MDTQVLATLPLWLAAFLLSLTAHEAAHALVGKLGGDTTAAAQVTLDLDTKILRSDGPVSGSTRLGKFEAGGLYANLDQRTVSLTKRARLKIEQGAFR